MKWINHLLIGGSLTATINPIMIPVAMLGSTAPDWLESLAHRLGYRIKHRTITHYVSLWVLGMLFSLFVIDFHGILFWFAFGGLTHLFCDALTVMGVPIGFWSDRKVHLFGGRLRTGQTGEYFIAFGVVIFSILFGWSTGQFKDGFTPFFFRWDQLYQNGIIDGYEWKKNRFRWI